MVKYDSFGVNESKSEMLFDLRTFRARLIGLHMLDIKNAKDDKDYAVWFRSIELLYGIVNHLIKEKEKYNQLKLNTLRVILEHDKVYLGKSFNPKGIALLEDTLTELEMFIYEKMEDKGVFGKREDYRGL